MKLIGFILTILLSVTCTAGLFDEGPSKADLNKNLRIENLIDETHDMKLIDFIEHGYPGAKISWKESAKNDYYLTIKYKNEMRNQSNLIKYHLKFGPNYVDMLEASADGEVIPPRMFPSIFVQMLLAIGQETGNKKFVLKSKSSSSATESTSDNQVNSAKQNAQATTLKPKKDNKKEDAVAKAQAEKEKKIEEDRKNLEEEKLKLEAEKKNLAIEKAKAEKLEKIDKFITKIEGQYCGDNKVNLNFEKFESGKIKFSTIGNKCNLKSKEVEIFDFVDISTTASAKLEDGCIFRIRPDGKSYSDNKIGISLGFECDFSKGKEILGCDYTNLLTEFKPCKITNLLDLFN